MTTAIDVSLLPPPEAIRPLSYAAIKAERIASLGARFAAAGIPWDVGALETDSGVILQEEDAFRELLDKGAINDGIRAVLPAYARGANLEAIAARANVGRLTLSPADPATGAPAVLESDAALLRRYLVSFSAPAAGSEDGYIYRTLAAWPAARDVCVLGPEVHGRRGRAEIVLLGQDGTPVVPVIVSEVYRALRLPSASPLTDEVVVRSAVIVPWTLSARLTVRRGPDPSLVRAQAEAAIRAAADEYFRIGLTLPANVVAGILRVPNVVAVAVDSPGADVAPALPADRPRAAPYLAAVLLSTELLP